jgi:aspartate/methionine/tyrosine aminotransferase
MINHKNSLADASSIQNQTFQAWKVLTNLWVKLVGDLDRPDVISTASLDIRKSWRFYSNFLHLSYPKMQRLCLETLSKTVREASYAVRGAIVSRAGELNSQLAAGKKLPFKEIIACNIGNPHALQQPALSFVRDVVALTVNPELIKRVPAGVFPADVVARANKYLYGKGGCTDMGAYSESKGIMAVREDVCKFLQERDGFSSNPDDIFLTNGASDGVRLCMQTMLRPSSAGFKDGVLTPIPQYPLYSALTTVLDAHLVPYYLDESHNWGFVKQTLAASVDEASKRGIETRGLVVINPGNPTGQILSEQTMRGVVEFCTERGIVLLADEVYQENIWASGKRFHSFRKVAQNMGALKGDKSGLQLISFHSISKGFLGECGLRGGYFECLGIDPKVKDELYKLASISLCSNTVGQVATGIMVQPPKQGDESYALYVKERDDILHSLKRRASKIAHNLNQLEGVECNESEGAMYAFPNIKLPAKAIAAAKAANMEADAFYCMHMLENTGIVTVPGSGFKQEKGTYHFRITILPPENKMDTVFELLAEFHKKFYDQYR